MRSLISRSGGGKSQLCGEIVKFFPPRYKTYAEPFCGAAWVLLKETRPGVRETVNDCDERLINFFKMLKEKPGELHERICAAPEITKELFTRLREVSFDVAAPEAERAAAYFLTLRSSYLSNGDSFNAKASRLKDDAKFKERLHGKILRAAERISGVEINCGDFEDFVTKTDSPETFYYFDPPYYRCNKAQRRGFALADFKRLFALLEKLSGKWLTSFDDCGFVRAELSGKGYDFVEVKRLNGFTTPGNELRSTPYYELLIKNY
jgi:DNA adenine methylase